MPTNQPIREIRNEKNIVFAGFSNFAKPTSDSGTEDVYVGLRPDTRGGRVHAIQQGSRIDNAGETNRSWSGDRSRQRVYENIQRPDLDRRKAIVNIGRDGNTAIRLHTEPGDNNVSGSGLHERNDISVPMQNLDSIAGKEQWYAHSVYFPDDYNQPPPGHWGAVFDFHDSKNQGGQANFQMLVQNGVITIYGHGGPDVVYDNKVGNQYSYKAEVGPLVKKVWFDFVYHVKWSPYSDGLMEVWVNGKKLLSHAGPNLYEGYGVYLKLANYHSAYGLPVSVIHDRVKLGLSAKDVAIGALE